MASWSRSSTSGKWRTLCRRHCATCTSHSDKPFIFTVDAVGTQSLFADGEGLGQIKAKKEVIFLHAGILVCTFLVIFPNLLSYVHPPSLPPPPLFSLLHCREVLFCASLRHSALLWRVWRKCHYNSPRRASSAWDEPSTTPKSLSIHCVSANRN